MEDEKFTQAEVAEAKRRLLIEKEALRQIEAEEQRKSWAEDTLRFDIMLALEKQGYKLHLLHEKSENDWGKRRIEYFDSSGNIYAALCLPEDVEAAIAENQQRNAAEEAEFRRLIEQSKMPEPPPTPAQIAPSPSPPSKTAPLRAIHRFFSGLIAYFFEPANR